MKTNIFDNAVEFDNGLFDCLTKSQKAKAEIKGKLAGIIFNKRAQLGMNQKEFAKHMGVTQGLVSKWESSQYNFTVETLVDILDKLDMKLEMLVDDYCVHTNREPKEAVVFEFYKSSNKWDFSGNMSELTAKGA